MNRKVRYMYMPKDKKKVIRTKYTSTKEGKNSITILNRLFLEGILCLIIGIIMLVYSIIDKMEWHYYGLSIILIIGGVVFLIAQYCIRLAKYDKYIEEMNKKSK